MMDGTVERSNATDTSGWNAKGICSGPCANARRAVNDLPTAATSSVSIQFNGRAPMRLDKGGLFGVPAHETLPQARPRMAP